MDSHQLEDEATVGGFGWKAVDWELTQSAACSASLAEHLTFVESIKCKTSVYKSEKCDTIKEKI